MLPNPYDSPEYLRLCAVNEAGRAKLAIDGYASPDTAAYFAREAWHSAGLLLPEEPAAAAKRITETLWSVSERYHAGDIGHATFTEYNLKLWREAERLGIAGTVTDNLRKAR